MIRNIALVAHDARKVELLDWVKFNAGLPAFLYRNDRKAGA